MRIAIAQLNLVVGDVEGNASKIAKAYAQAQGQQADILVTPELSLLGYPPKDILLNSALLGKQEKALRQLARNSRDTALVVGWAQKNLGHGKPLYNAASALWRGKIIATHKKTLLPFYDVFDEGRYFEPGKKISNFKFKGLNVALSICEDIWNDKNYWEKRNYANDPLAQLKKIRPDMLINISASPYWRVKPQEREKMIQAIAKNCRLPLIYANLVGGNDDLIFDGSSLAVNAQGSVLARGSFCQEALIVFDLHDPRPTTHDPRLSCEQEIYDALVLGTRDYVRKCGFQKAVLGLSGGIDSSLVACIAADALGKENVLGVSMPSRFSSQHSKEDAEILAKNLGIEYKIVSIEPVFESYLKLFGELFPGLPSDLREVGGPSPSNIAEENIQARIRGAILMAVSNKQGHLLLATGNKSEIAMGYCTLYGDLMGGLAPISDLPKGWVYKLSRFRNQKSVVIPERVFIKAPSAELKPNQTDQDTLPPYDLLDQILKLYVVEGKSGSEIKRKLQGEGDLIGRVLRTVDLNEFKRRQAPPGLKVSKKAFGFGRRMPVACKLEHGRLT